MVAFRKYRGGVAGAAALGKAYYKGGFEPKMNRREAALILQLRYRIKAIKGGKSILTMGLQ